MAREIPQVVRAAAGLAATMIDETRRLPALPLRMIGTTMQLSMRLQQQYAGLVARGDELLTGLRGAHEPGLATFDEDDDIAAGIAPTAASAFDRVPETIIEVTDDDGDAQPDRVRDELAIEELVDRTPASDGAEGLADAVLDSDAVLGSDAAGAQGAAGVTAGASEATAEPSDVGTTVDVLNPAGGIETVEATITDEGIAAVEGATGQAAGEATPPAADAPTIEGVAAASTGSEPAGESTDGPAGAEGAGIGPVTLADTGTPRADSEVTEDSPIAAATGVRVDIETSGAGAPAEDAEPSTGESPAGGDADADAGGQTAPRVAAATGVRIDVPDSSSADDAAGQGGQPVAGATGVAVDVDDIDATAEEDAARARGAEVNAVGAESATPTDDPQGGGELAGAQLAGMAPVEGYDGFSIAQLRARLRGYERSTVEELLAYEETTRDREPYGRMLRNRLERLDAGDS